MREKEINSGQRSLQESEFFDLHAAQEALLIDSDMILELVRQFVNDRNNYTEPLRSALLQRDWKDLKSQAHRLKGAAQNLRVHGISKPALDLELASEKEQVHACEVQLHLIESRFTKIQAEV